MNIKGMAHLAFRVRNIDETLRFYCDILGFKKKFVLEEKSWNLKIFYVQINPNQFIEFFPSDQDLSENKNISYQHLCLEVENIKELVAELRDKAVEIDSEIIMGLDNNYQAWIHDPDGNPIELMEYGKDSLQLK